MTDNIRAHPWMANSAPGSIQAMLNEIGAKSISDVFEQIPQDHFRTTPLDLPPALSSEIELKRDLISKLKKEVRDLLETKEGEVQDQKDQYMDEVTN